MKRIVILIVLFLVAAGAVFYGTNAATSSKPHKTIVDRLAEYGASARKRLAPHFENAKVTYPPARVVLLGIKNERKLELYAASGTNTLQFIRSWPILAASGGPGPKLREGDYQVPEGIYPIELLNPNSSYHLSFRVGYPNSFDREQAKREGRSNLGGDIMIHGKSVSIGCLAMGDEAAEDLFVLAADTGIDKLTVVLTPVDFRKGQTVPSDATLPPWIDELYKQIKTRLAELPKP